MAPRILIAEDDEPLARLWTKAFQKAGYRVERVANGIDAICSLRQALPDLLLVDYRMPGAKGDEVLAFLKRMDTRHRVVSVLVTAHLLEADDPLRAQCNLYLQKPVLYRDLVALAGRLLRQVTETEVAPVVRLTTETQVAPQVKAANG